MDSQINSLDALYTAIKDNAPNAAGIKRAFKDYLGSIANKLHDEVFQPNTQLDTPDGEAEKLERRFANLVSAVEDW